MTKNKGGNKSLENGLKVALVTCTLLFAFVLFSAVLVSHSIENLTKSTILFVLTILVSLLLGEMLFSITATVLAKGKVLGQELGFTFGLTFFVIVSFWGFQYHNPFLNNYYFAAQILTFFLAFNGHIFLPISIYRKVECPFRLKFRFYGKNEEIIKVSNQVYLKAFAFWFVGSAITGSIVFLYF